MKINENWIEAAMEAVKEAGIVENNTYPQEYKGYVSALGAAIIQSGLLSAVLFYENSTASQEDKSKLIRTIVLVLNRTAGYQINVTERFSRYLLARKTERFKILADVNKAALAIKLALRIFNIKEE